MFQLRKIDHLPEPVKTPLNKITISLANQDPVIINCTATSSDYTPKMTPTPPSTTAAVKEAKSKSRPPVVEVSSTKTAGPASAQTSKRKLKSAGKIITSTPKTTNTSKTTTTDTPKTTSSYLIPSSDQLLETAVQSIQPPTEELLFPMYDPTSPAIISKELQHNTEHSRTIHMDFVPKTKAAGNIPDSDAGSSTTDNYRRNKSRNPYPDSFKSRKSKIDSDDSDDSCTTRDSSRRSTAANKRRRSVDSCATRGSSRSAAANKQRGSATTNVSEMQPPPSSRPASFYNHHHHHRTEHKTNNSSTTKRRMRANSHSSFEKTRKSVMSASLSAVVKKKTITVPTTLRETIQIREAISVRYPLISKYDFCDILTRSKERSEHLRIEFDKDLALEEAEKSEEYGHRFLDNGDFVFPVTNILPVKQMPFIDRVSDQDESAQKLKKVLMNTCTKVFTNVSAAGSESDITTSADIECTVFTEMNAVFNRTFGVLNHYNSDLSEMELFANNLKQRCPWFKDSAVAEDLGAVTTNSIMMNAWKQMSKAIRNTIEKCLMSGDYEEDRLAVNGLQAKVEALLNENMKKLTTPVRVLLYELSNISEVFAYICFGVHFDGVERDVAGYMNVWPGLTFTMLSLQICKIIIVKNAYKNSINSLKRDDMMEGYSTMIVACVPLMHALDLLPTTDAYDYYESSVRRQQKGRVELGDFLGKSKHRVFDKLLETVKDKVDGKINTNNNYTI